MRSSSADRRLNHAVAVAQPAALPARELPFPPYALGAWLGAGTTGTANLTPADPEIIAEIEAEGSLHRSVPALLRGIGVLSDKHIPAEYLRASEDQRRALLAGLLDTGGYADEGRYRPIQRDQLPAGC